MGSSCSRDEYQEASGHGYGDDEKWCRPLPVTKGRRKLKGFSRKKKQKNTIIGNNDVNEADHDAELDDHDDRRHELAQSSNHEELLSRISGRICSNGATSSACAFTQQGRKGANQDAMIVWENFASRKDTVFCGVFDGHGPCGHLVARHIRDMLPLRLMAMWKARMRGESNLLNDTDDDYDLEDYEETNDFDQHSTDDIALPETMVQWKECMIKCCILIDKDLKTHPTIDSFCSGTTGVILLKQGNDILIGNVGDSRAVLGVKSHNGGNKFEAVQLTLDLKPSVPNEAERIRRCKGRVFALGDEPEVLRVWLPYDDAPGLAMARAFGDFCLKDYGLISLPHITYHRLTPNDQFLVMATDGVWDVLSNTEVVNVVSCISTPSTAAKALVQAAVRAWRRRYPSSKADDCAAICLFLNHHQYYYSSSNSSKKNSFPKFQVLQNHHVKKQEEEGNSNEVNECSSYQDSRTIKILEEDRASSSNDMVSHTQLALDMSHCGDNEDMSWDKSNAIPNSHPFGDGHHGSIHEHHNDRHEIEIVSEIIPDVNMNQQNDPPCCNLNECLATPQEKEWSALEGVVRVNSLINLPRFKVGDTRSTLARIQKHQ